jgi:hypothetical protein
MRLTSGPSGEIQRLLNGGNEGTFLIRTGGFDNSRALRLAAKAAAMASVPASGKETCYRPYSTGTSDWTAKDATWLY